MPVHDRVMPAAEGAAQAAQLGRAVGVLQVLGEFAELGAGESRAVDVVEPADGFCGVPCQADLAAGIAGGERAAEFGVAAVVETFVSGDQQAPRAMQRVVLAAAAAQSAVLGSSAASSMLL